jgi:hypothetical protein
MPIMNGFEATKYIRNTMNLQIRLSLQMLLPLMLKNVNPLA